jgi:hypothetical protein
MTVASMQKQIVFVVNKKAEMEITVDGAKGKECLALTAGLEKCMELDVEDRTLRPEYHETNETHIENQTGGD